MFDEVRRYADLAPDDAILEIGAGTGRATQHFAAWGNPLLAVESAPAMADIARTNLAAFPNVEVRTARFEDIAVESHSYGLVACAQTWHWLDPETRVERFADALYAHGTAALIANQQIAVDEHLEFFVRVLDVYDRFAPDIRHKGDFLRRDTLPPHALERSSLFEDVLRFEHEWEWSLSTDDYIGLMSTASPHAALDPDVRRRLHDGIAALIDDEFGGRVTENYVAVADVARRV